MNAKLMITTIWGCGRLSVHGGNFVLHVAVWDHSIVRSRQFGGGRFSEVTGTCIMW